MKQTKEMDMLHGGLAGKLIVFAIPLACSSILQQLFNSADVAVVGRFAGDQALVAVGSCVALVGIFVNLIVGLSVGPNAVVANLIGQKKREQINGVLHTIMAFGMLLGLVLMLLGMLSARVILEASGTPESVLGMALLYIRIYFLSIPFMLIYNFGSAILRSYGDSRRPMYYLMFSGIVNVILNLVLVICFQLGVVGVAIATFISNILSASLTVLRGMGRSLAPSIITVIGTVVFRLVWMVTVFRRFPTYEMLMNVYVASWIFTGVATFVVYAIVQRKLEKTA